uniref:type I restriction endonuclease n=1 Tax=Bacteroides uniformis TaxID=820 RepID=UPI004025BA4E
MFDDKNKFIAYQGLKWSGILKGISKSQNPFQPLFEAFTNSLESIRMRQAREDVFQPYITITLNFNSDLESERVDLQSINIIDNGIGFDSENFNRLKTFKDDTKGFNNRGSGRIQMIHSFQIVNYKSSYKENGNIYHREFTLSKISRFIDNNSIIYNTQEPILKQNEEVRTELELLNPITKDGKEFTKVSVDDIKKILINHYILAFCNIKAFLPQIKIIYCIGGQEQDSTSIGAEDIPDPTRRDIFIEVPICQISEDMKRIEPVSGSSVSINVLPYKINQENLATSEIKVTSKGEISDSTKIKLTCIDPYASLDNCRYLFLLSSNYFDELDGDERGNIEIIDKTEFKKRAKSQGYIENQIVLNDIQEAVNNKASEIYTEISVKNEEFKNTLKKLKEDYLLSDEALAEVSLGDSLDEVFKKAYNYDAKLMASQTASYEKSIQSLVSLNPVSETYQEQLSNLVNDLVKSLPLQNRATLSKYVARRKMVIELMGKILERMTDAQEAAQRNEDEKLLHDLIFRQHNENPLNSDLWLINEEYMYFKGTSESQLSKIKIDGEKIFRDDFDAEEQRYLTSLGENRMKMRTDVLLFPSEGKCVIIEFKNPNVNVSDCLSQITKYAYFLRNFAKPKFRFVTFYGYLIGESVERRDVRSADGDFIAAPNLDYIFRPRKNIPDDSGTNLDGSLYMEVLKFSVLKERAEIRNKAFIDRILGNSTDSTNNE